MQQDVAEAIAQIAMFPPGREALLQDPTVAEALKQVAAEGWTAAATAFASAAAAASAAASHATASWPACASAAFMSVR